MRTNFEDLVKIGVMTKAEAENLSVLSAALDAIENIGPRVGRDRQSETGENDPIPAEARAEAEEALEKAQVAWEKARAAWEKALAALEKARAEAEEALEKAQVARNKARAALG
jgi:multidrug resistance efflux pump